MMRFGSLCGAAVLCAGAPLLAQTAEVPDNSRTVELELSEG